MRDFDLRALQLIELEMLKDFHAFCEENDIVYFMNSGTLLGAARHQGFIPWDDDIDVCMDVKNYKKFLKLAPSKFPREYFCQNYRTDHKVGIRWTRVRKNGTTSMERNMTGYEIHYGVCMDVFVINGLRKTKLGKYLQAKASQLLTILLEKHFIAAAGYEVSSHIQMLYQYIPEKLRLLMCRILENIIRVDTERGEWCYNTWFNYPSTGDECVMPSEVFRPTERIKMKFEDGEFYAPQQYETYLELEYGDWKTIPPESERVTHGDIIVDLENDYSTYFTGHKV